MYKIGSSWLKTKKPEKEVKPVDSLYLKLPLRQFKTEKMKSLEFMQKLNFFLTMRCVLQSLTFLVDWGKVLYSLLETPR